MIFPLAAELIVGFVLAIVSSWSSSKWCMLFLQFALIKLNFNLSLGGMYPVLLAKCMCGT